MKTKAKLTPYEQALVGAMAGGEVVPHHVLAEVQVVKRPPPQDERNRIITHMKNLRRKGVKVETVHGVGYRIKHDN